MDFENSRKRFRPLMNFEIETETWVYREDVPWDTDSENICFHAVR